MLSCLCACGGPVPVWLTATDQGTGLKVPNEQTSEILDDAFGFWGLQYTLENDQVRGRLVIDLVHLDPDKPQENIGTTADHGRCQIHIRSIFNWRTLSHEIGHAFGLSDVEGSNTNIMNVDYQNLRMVEDDDILASLNQIDTVQEEAHSFSNCVLSD